MRFKGMNLEIYSFSDISAVLGGIVGNIVVSLLCGHVFKPRHCSQVGMLMLEPNLGVRPS